MSYVYETHLHTIEASACSVTPGEDYVEYMKAFGYAGIIVTDHFFTGNSCVPRDLPWNERVARYVSGYKHALEKAGDDFTVLFGIEFNFEGDEFLLYGVDEKWLLETPEIMDMSRQELYRAVHDAGGIMLQAHPYRDRSYLSEIHITPGCSDGVEVYNAANPDWQNAQAYMYAEERGLRMCGGSDIHSRKQRNMGGMRFERPIETIEDFAAAFMAGEGTPVYKMDVHSVDGEFLEVSTNPDLSFTNIEPMLQVFWH
jgi:hypothetical protein